MAGRDRGGLSKLLQWVWFALAATAIYKELQKPADEREWNGQVAGVVPYDFRVPTVERVRERLWDPYGGFVSPQVFGVGWTLNLGRAWREVKERAGTDDFGFPD
jgi:hypothetical protein